MVLKRRLWHELWKTAASCMFFGFRTQIMLWILMYVFMFTSLRWCTTPSRLSITTAVTHQNKMPPFLGHVARMGDSQDTFRALHMSICIVPKERKRRPDRPRHIWLQTIEADLQPLNHGLNSAWRLAEYRGWRRQLVDMATLQSGAWPRWWWWWLLYLFVKLAVSKI